MADGSIMRLRQLVEYLNLSRSAIYDRLDKKSKRYDKTFPKQIKLGGCGGAVGWLKADIDAWLANCARNGASPQSQTNSPASVETSTRQTLVRDKEPLRASKKTSAPSESSQALKSYPLMPSTSPTSRSVDFVDLIVEGRQRNKLLTEYLKLDIWTPAMTALLVCGIEPPNACTAIPLNAVDLDNQKLHANDNRLRIARQMLEDWLDQKPPPNNMRPLDFLIWCDEDGVNTEWFRLLMNLSGNETHEAADLSASHFALKTDR